jgi:hypothetical protein
MRLVSSTLDPSRKPPPDVDIFERVNKMFVKLLFSAILFYVFVPGVLLNLSTPFTSPAVTHAIIFALVSGFVWKAAKPMLPKY